MLLIILTIFVVSSPFIYAIFEYFKDLKRSKKRKRIKKQKFQKPEIPQNFEIKKFNPIEENMDL